MNKILLSLLLLLSVQLVHGRSRNNAQRTVFALDRTVGNVRLWKLRQAEFMRPFKGCRGFSWSDSSRTHLHYVLRNSQMPMTFAGEVIYEGDFFFDDNNSLESIELSIFNRGDAGLMKEKDFDQRLDNITKKLDFFCSAEPGGHWEKSKSINGGKLHARLWHGIHYTMRLSWSGTGRSKYFYGEFIKVNIFPLDKNADILPELRTEKLTDPAERIKTADNGDKYLEVPMTDQGAKAYCVASTIERILKYYGSEADQHLIAQLSKSSSFGGTSLENMKKAMDDAANRFGIKVDELYEDKMFSSISDMRKTISRYNKLAKKLKAAKLDANDFIRQKWRTIYYNPYRMLQAMDFDIYQRVRCESEKREFAAFIDEVKKNIDRGAPLAWCVVMGLVKETGRKRGISGHMRLIIGYNDKLRQIIYSDSWGKGHEFKKMTYEQAWAITSALYIFEPRGRR